MIRGQPDHPDRGVAAALDVDRFAEQFCANQNLHGVEFGHTRIGIHTGEAFVGNLGTRKRQQYGAVGDILNTASRLEGLNKETGTRICVSGETTSKCRDHRFKPVGEFVLAGKQTAIQVYVPIDPTLVSATTLQRYEEAYRLLDTDPSEAAAKFAELSAEDQSDPCVKFHQKRLDNGESGTIIYLEKK